MDLDQFRQLADLLPEPLLLVTRNGRIVAANRRFASDFAAPLEQMIGTSLQDWVQNDSSELARYLRSCSRARETLPGSITFRAHQEKVTCEGALAQQQTDQGPALILLRFPAQSTTIRHFHLLTQKINELTKEVDHRKQVEQSLRISESRKTAILNTAIDCIITVDQDTRIVDFNRAAEELFGYRSEQVLGRSMVDFIIPHDARESYLRGWQEYQRTGISKIVGKRNELVALKADGSIFPVELSVSVIELRAGNQLFTGYLRDISQRVKDQQALEEQLRLADLGKNVGLALSQSWSLPEMLQKCSELVNFHLEGAFTRIWSVSEDSTMLVLQASAGAYVHLDGEHSRIPMGQYKIGRIAQSQKPHLTNAVLGDERVHDQEWARRTGMVAFAGYPLLVDNRTVGVLAMFAQKPLTKSVLRAMESIASSIALGMVRLQSEQRLQEHTQALQLAHRRKDEFLAMLGHELRNPLTPIRTGLEVLEMQYGSNETLSLMQEQMQHVVRLVDDLLDVSRIVRGKIRLRRAPVQLSELIARAVNVVEHLAQERQHVLTIEPIDETLWVKGDMIRLLQVLTNLLTNAVKYTLPGGSISVAVQAENSQALILVKDNGIGISPELLPEVFELFTQEARALDRAEGGLGIGLTIVKQIVELHQGSIRAHSEGKGKGSEFHVHLPLTQAPKVPEQDATPQSEIQRNRQVLIVDDNKAAAVLLRTLLINLGNHQVSLAHDGPTGLQMALTEKPDVLLLDIGLPEMDGYEVIQKFRQHPHFQQCVVTALTGYGQPEDRQKSSEAGFDLHLVKPPDLQDLEKVFAHAKLSQHTGSAGRLEPSPSTANPAAPSATNRHSTVAVSSPSSQISLPMGVLRDLAHEMGNLVFPLQMLAFHLQKQTEPEKLLSRTREITGTVLPNAKLLLEILRRLTRALQGDVSQQRADVDLSRLIAEVVAHSQEHAQRKQQHVHIHLPPDPGLIVVGHEEDLRTAILEVVENAIAYTDVGGALNVEAREGVGTYVVEVIDSGSGIPPELFEKAFEPFVRGQEKLDLKNGHVGLGLTLAREIISRHGGTIRLSKVPEGTGTRCTISLPTAKQREH